jgi:ubiquinone/menaquinone biosynthesis C-methylase UbiE
MGEARTTVQEQFGRVATAYVHSRGHAEGDDLERLVELARATPADDALDIATGGGHTALALARVAGTVMATDLTPEMLTAAEEHIRGAGMTNVNFRIADAQALPFGDASFDLVTCRIAPHHFPQPDAFARQVRRVLRPSGRFLLEDSIVPAGEPGAFLNRVEAVRDRSHVRSLTLDEWWTLLLDAGFRVRRIETFRKRHELTDWMERMQTPSDAQAEVRSSFAAAPDSARRAFDIEYDAAGRAVAYWDQKALWVCE